MDNHIREEPEKHLSYIGDALLSFQKVINEHHDTLKQQETKLESIDMRVSHLNDKLKGCTPKYICVCWKG